MVRGVEGASVERPHSRVVGIRSSVGFSSDSLIFCARKCENREKEQIAPVAILS